MLRASVVVCNPSIRWRSIDRLLACAEASDSSSCFEVVVLPLGSRVYIVADLSSSSLVTTLLSTSWSRLHTITYFCGVDVSGAYDSSSTIVCVSTGPTELEPIKSAPSIFEDGGGQRAAAAAAMEVYCSGGVGASVVGGVRW